MFEPMMNAGDEVERRAVLNFGQDSRLSIFPSMVFDIGMNPILAGKVDMKHFACN